MINEKRLLNSANALFLDRKFSEALFLYAQLVSYYPEKPEYSLYALLCDVGQEDSVKALSLYDYFQVEKQDGEEEALNHIKEMVDTFDGDINQMMDLLKSMATSSFETLDAIEYNDFKTLIKARGSFKVAFEDIMFSSKVAIESKEDFLDFVQKLIENDFNTTAYQYLEGFNEYFIYDKKIKELYELLNEKQIATKHKQ